MAAEPPFYLTLAWYCERWRCLPRDGGILAQPLAEIVRMQTALNVYNAIRARHQATNAVEFSQRAPAVVEFCAGVDKLRGYL